MAATSMCFVILSDTVDDTFADVVSSLRRFCPDADIAWYNSGQRRDTPFDLLRVRRDRPLKYMKITPAFFDILEWAAESEYDYVVNVETDMAFIRPGFQDYVQRQLRDAHYLAPGLRHRTPEVSLWPSYHSLAKDRQELLSIMGMSHTNRAFCPAQVFSREYATTLLSSDMYSRVRSFVERNQQPERSSTLQELILPTLAEALGLTSRSYAAHLAQFNRFRPYQAMRDVEQAQRTPDAYFIHPVRRSSSDPVRAWIRDLVRTDASIA
ncbi:hypothetical protein AB0M47_27675 [Hamadaea sp. NPDC051192]|uniref:hypothetical protein n=1 Tax=Hamadaea sp. NPDC051192 TaxID=3154940 RepID=UPI003438BEB2